MPSGTLDWGVCASAPFGQTARPLPRDVSIPAGRCPPFVPSVPGVRRAGTDGTASDVPSGREVIFHSGNGILGMGPKPSRARKTLILRSWLPAADSFTGRHFPDDPRRPAPNWQVLMPPEPPRRRPKPPCDHKRIPRDEDLPRNLRPLIHSTLGFPFGFGAERSGFCWFLRRTGGRGGVVEARVAEIDFAKAPDPSISWKNHARLCVRARHLGGQHGHGLSRI